MKHRLIFLNALPLSSIPFEHFCIDVRRLSRLEDIEYDIKKAKSINAEIISYIRHEAVLNLLNKIFNLNLVSSPGLYEWRENDEIIVITLKRGILLDIHDLESDDLEIFYVYVSKMCY
jgi:hypothetical protein